MAIKNKKEFEFWAEFYHCFQKKVSKNDLQAIRINNPLIKETKTANILIDSSVLKPDNLIIKSIPELYVAYGF